MIVSKIETIYFSISHHRISVIRRLVLLIGGRLGGAWLVAFMGMHRKRLSWRPPFGHLNSPVVPPAARYAASVWALGETC